MQEKHGVISFAAPFYCENPFCKMDSLLCKSSHPYMEEVILELLSGNGLKIGAAFFIGNFNF